MIILGIDPGLTGALALLEHGKFICVEDLPVMARGGSGAKVVNQINVVALTVMLRNLLACHDNSEIHILIEMAQSMPATLNGKTIRGVASTMSTGLTAGHIEGIVGARGWPHTLVRPGVWKKALKIPSGKEAARAVAQRLYPEAPLTRKKDHNRAEALLIARYGHLEYS